MVSEVKINYEAADLDPSVVNLSIKIGGLCVLNSCGCCDGTWLGNEYYPATELIEVLQKALEAYAKDKNVQQR